MSPKCGGSSPRPRIAAATSGNEDDSVRGRDPSFQQSAAGHSSARRGERESAPDRRHHLQPVFLCEQRARFAIAGFSTRASARRATGTIDRSRAGRQRARARAAPGEDRPEAAPAPGQTQRWRRAQMSQRPRDRRARPRPPDIERRGSLHFTLAVAEESIQRKAVVYDRAGDAHYDTISAFIKSMRASDEKAPSTGWPKCCMPAKTFGSSRAAS